MPSTLHLVIPGLLGPWRHPVNPAFPRPVAPALEWLLARAEVVPAPASAEAVLFALFATPAPAEADLPVAAITRLADGGQTDEGWWWRADPVHFHTDFHSVVLLDARALAIQPEEARALAAAFNDTFADEGLQLDALRPERWYVRLADDPGVRTWPLAAAAGRDIRDLLPYGPQKNRWHRLSTEIQMLFHTHPVNRTREERNQPLISGIWFWGGGRLPSAVQTPAAGLYANDPLTRGLAQRAGATISPAPASAADWLDAADGESDSLVVLDITRHDPADDDIAQWAEHIALLERDWFAPGRRLLQTNRLATWRLHPGNGRQYTITAAARWRFWHRAKSLLTYLADSG